MLLFFSGEKLSDLRFTRIEYFKTVNDDCHVRYTTLHTNTVSKGMDPPLSPQLWVSF